MQVWENTRNINVSYSWLKTDTNIQADLLSRGHVPEDFKTSGARWDPGELIFPWFIESALDTWEAVGATIVVRQAVKSFEKYIKARNFIGM